MIIPFRRQPQASLKAQPAEAVQLELYPTAPALTTTTACKKMRAKIKIAQKQLGLDDETYREMLHNLFAVTSSTQLGYQQLHKLLVHLQGLGLKKQTSRNKPVNKLYSLKINKIEALLAEKGRVEGKFVPWSYAESISNRMYGTSLDKAESWQLDGVIAVLHRNAVAKNRYTEEWGREC